MILSVILIGLILLQHSDAGAGTAFGTDSLGGAGHTRRGAEKAVFVFTLVIAVLFAASAFVALLIR